MSTTAALGLRFALGGRAGRVRTALTALGVAIGVAVLLLAASVPNALAARDARASARADIFYGTEPAAGPGTLLVGDASTSVTGDGVRIRLLHPEGRDAPVPPGLSALPGNGQMALSPALRALLDSPQGALLRARLPYDDVATIAAAGLLGPGELAAYAGDDRVVPGGLVRRVESFGDPFEREPLDPVLSLLVVVGVAVLLLPVGVFVATAARFGAEGRDRRLAALRLLGLDAPGARRVAAGEAAVAALIGVGVGVVAFAAGRHVLGWVSVEGISVFAADVRPSPVLAAAALVAVPVVAVAATLLGLRAVVLEPLGVARRARPARRRAGWRLGLLGLGAALLVWQVAAPRPLGAGPDQRVVLAAVVTALLGVLAVLPWLVDAVVARLGAGSLAWQLAVRRLQSGGATSGRVAAGVAVAVTGVIALQALFTGLAASYTTATGQDPSRTDALVESYGASGAEAAATAAALAAAPGAQEVLWTTAVTAVAVDDPDTSLDVVVGDCAALAQLADVPSCADGDVFTTDPSHDQLVGQGVHLDGQGPPPWTVPATAVPAAAVTDPMGRDATGSLLATPGAVDLEGVGGATLRAFVRTAPGDPGALTDLVRAAAEHDPLAVVQVPTATDVAGQFTGVRRALTAGAAVVLLAIGASLLVSSSEQLRERAAVLSALAAIGVRRSTVAASVLLDAAVPVVLGLGLALVAGSVLGALLLVLVGVPPVWVPGAAAAVTASAAAVLLLVTALSLPGLRRAMQPLGVRVE